MSAPRTQHWRSRRMLQMNGGKWISAPYSCSEAWSVFILVCGAQARTLSREQHTSITLEELPTAWKISLSFTFRHHWLEMLLFIKAALLPPLLGKRLSEKEAAMWGSTPLSTHFFFGNSSHSFGFSSMTAGHQLLLGLVAWHVFTLYYPLTALCRQAQLCLREDK